MGRLPRLRALFLGLLLVLTTAPATLAYQGQVATNVTITGPLGTVSCGTAYDVSATVFDQLGNKIAGQAVTWTIQSHPLGASDAVNPASTTTNQAGIATTSITFNGVPGDRTIRATADLAFAQIIISPVAPCGSTPPPPPPAVHVVIGSCASALGLDPTSGYSSSTKVAALGAYLTFRLSFGPAYAGRSIVITHAVLNGSGWSNFLGATTRTADGNGDVLYHFRSTTSGWISVRGAFPGTANLDPAVTPACRGRWR